MTNNLFQIAINNNEIAEFFRGQGKYFVASRDYDGHVHGAHMGGCVRVYVEESPENSESFDNAFLLFLGSLDVSKEDLNHLLANLSSYCAQRSRNGFPDSHLFDDREKQAWIDLNCYLYKIYNSPFQNEVKDKIMRHANFINKKGYRFVIDIISNFNNFS
jgi:hypothetical protein